MIQLLLSRLNFFLFVSCLLVLSSCNPDYSPKPKAYPRVIFPERKYELYEPSACPFEFEKPLYASVYKDSTFLGKKMDEPCWMNVEFKDLNGTLNLTYKEITKEQPLEKLIEDAHKLSFKHSKKANFIDETMIANKHGVYGLLYNVGGDAASSLQFFVTDSTRHYLRGALYFNSEVNSDSMAPVIDFVKKDIDHILATFRWK